MSERYIWAPKAEEEIMRTGNYGECKTEAKAFHGVAEWISEQHDLGSFLSGYMFPYFVNAAFSCELYIKAIMIFYSPENEFPKEHELEILFRKLPKSDRAEIEKNYNQQVNTLKNCWDFDGRRSSYTEEMLSDLESVGMVAFIECIRIGDYDPEKGALTTYVIPRIDGAMRRHMESSLGTLSLDRDSMSFVRKVQRMHHEEGLTAAEIGELLGIPEAEAARHLSYPTHFFSFYDLADKDGDEDVLSYLSTASTVSPEQIVCRKLRMEYMEELFQTLTRKERDILGKCYGVFGYAKAPLREIAMYHMIKEDAVVKAKNRALKKLRDRYPGSRMREWDRIVRLMNYFRE